MMKDSEIEKKIKECKAFAIYQSASLFETVSRMFDFLIFFTIAKTVVMLVMLGMLLILWFKR